jgi:nitrate reductase assembly molybdenum cofactor insertion protein NarJ
MTSVTIVADGLAEAARWHLLALLFERPRAHWREDVARLSRETTDPVLRALADAAGAAREGDYLRLLGPGGAVSPREVGHAGGFRDPGWILSDLARFYDAFGYRPRAEDPADHVAVELGFVAYLHLKEALARSTGDEESAAVTSAARDAFVREHVAGFVRSMADRLGPAAAPHLAGALDVATRCLPEIPVPRGQEGADPLAGGCGACTAE